MLRFLANLRRGNSSVGSTPLKRPMPLSLPLSSVSGPRLRFLATLRRGNPSDGSTPTKRPLPLSLPLSPISCPRLHFLTNLRRGNLRTDPPRRSDLCRSRSLCPQSQSQARGSASRPTSAEGTHRPDPPRRSDLCRYRSLCPLSQARGSASWPEIAEGTPSAEEASQLRGRPTVERPVTRDRTPRCGVRRSDGVFTG
jgi:hypothetical protein